MDDPERRALAAQCFNEAWTFLEQDSRTAADDAAMLGAALASWYLWRQVGEAKNHSIADWQVSRVLAVLGHGQRARWYGESALHWAEEGKLGPFYAGYAHEALARAAAVAGDTESVSSHLGHARTLAARVEAAADRSALERDLETI